MKKLVLILLTAITCCCINLNADNAVGCNNHGKLTIPGWEAICVPVGKQVKVVAKFNNWRHIKKCKLFIGETFLGWQHKFPFDWKVKVHKPGNYHLKCVVYDKCGKQKVIKKMICIGGNTPTPTPTPTTCSWDADFGCIKQECVAPGSKVCLEVRNKMHIEKCVLYINGQSCGVEKHWPYEWKVPRLSPGRYKMVCKVLDKCGKWTPIEKTICIGDKTPTPSVCEWTGNFCPSTTQCVEDDFSVCVDFNGRHNAIRKCTLLIEGRKVGVDTRYPFTWSSSQYRALKNLAPGQHTLTCIAWDNCGNSQRFEKELCVGEKGEAPKGGGGSGGSCSPAPWFKAPRVCKFRGNFDVEVDVKNKQIVRGVKLFVDGRFVSQENNYPFEWSTRKGRDKKLRGLRRGNHKLTCVIMTTCGEVKEHWNFRVR